MTDRALRLSMFLCLTLLFACAMPWGAAAQEEAPTPGQEVGSEAEDQPAVSVPGPVVTIQLDSIIHPVAAEHVIESLDYADDIGASLLVIELNTPGGLLTSTREIFKAMMAARTPVAVYVGPSGAQAASAGFFLLMAADIAAMAPGSNTGAAHPVGGQGEDIEGHMGEKVEQDSAATIRSLARQHGRNEELAEAAVLESRSFTDQEALEQGLIEIVAPNLDSLLQQIDGREIEKAGEERVVLQTASTRVERRQMSPVKRLMSTIAHPNIAYILMALGWLGLYVELTHPGAIFPGVVGAICLILGFYAMSVLPVNYAGVALIALAVVLFVIETQVASFGLLTTGGVVALVLGSLMLFKDVDPAIRVATELIFVMSAGILLVVGGLSTRALMVRRSRVTTGAEGLIGETGVARSDLQPQGKVFVHGELWNAVSEDPLVAGSAIEVVAVQGLHLRVRAAVDSSVPRVV